MLTVGALTTNIDTYLAKRIGFNKLKSKLSHCDLFHSVTLSASTVFASDWARRLRKPHIGQAIGTDVNYSLPKSYNCIMVKGWEKSTNHVVCNSLGIKTKLKELYPEYSKVDVIYRGVDLVKFNPNNKPKGPQSNLAKNGVKFLYLGGVADRGDLPGGRDYKGGVTIMQAWSKLESLEEMSKSSLVFAGPDSSSNFANEWQSKLKYPERVHLMGNIKLEDVPGFMSASDVILLPSRNEGMPNVLLEAFASGKTAIASNVGGVPEVITDNFAVLLDPGNVKDWANSIIQFVKGDFDYFQMGQRARLHTEKNFDNKQFPIGYLRIYENILADRNA